KVRIGAPDRLFGAGEASGNLAVLENARAWQRGVEEPNLPLRPLLAVLEHERQCFAVRSPGEHTGIEVHVLALELSAGTPDAARPAPGPLHPGDQVVYVQRAPRRRPDTGGQQRTVRRQGHALQ